MEINLEFMGNVAARQCNIQVSDDEVCYNAGADSQKSVACMIQISHSSASLCKKSKT